MTRFVIVALLCGGSLFSGPGQASYDKANSIFIAKKFPEAFAAVEEALRLEPKLVPALTLKAKMAMAANRYDVARQALERALAVDPKAFYAQFLYGMEAYMNNNMTDALPRFRRARELAPKDARAALYLGLSVESVGRAGEALALYQEAVGLERAANQEQAETLLPGARLLVLLDRLEEAEQWIRRAVALSPKLRDAHFELARILLKKGNAAGAAAAGETALSLSEGIVTDSAIRYLLIRAWQQSGEPGRAAVHAAVIRAQEDGRVP
jgi:tetratricopeptide (TPR) repeat protein